MDVPMSSPEEDSNRRAMRRRVWGFALLALLLVSSLAAALRRKASGVPAAASTSETSSQAEVDPAARCRNWQEPEPYQREGSPEQRGTADAAQTAYGACREAYQTLQNDAEVAYQLAASALESGNMEDFAGPLQRAADMGYCKAFYHLGRDAWHDGDADKAQADYERGAACGDPRAGDELFQTADYAASAFPDYLQALYTSDIPRLNKVRFLSASYVDGFYEALSEQYLSSDFNPCWAAEYYRGGEELNRLREAEKGDASNFVESYLYEESLPVIYRVLVPAQGSKALDAVRETARKAGHADAYRMASRSHCKALLPYRMMQGVRNFALARKSLFQTAQEIAPNINSFADLQAYARQSADSQGRRASE